MSSSEFSDASDEVLGFHNRRYLSRSDTVICSRKTLNYGISDVLCIQNSETLKLIFVITVELQLK